MAGTPGWLRGRDTEWGVLQGLLLRVEARGPAIAVIQGEAGIGKTRMLEEIVQSAQVRGFDVTFGRAHELERTRPFGILADAFACEPTSPDPDAAAIASLLAARSETERGMVTVSSDPGLQFRVIDAWADLVERRALDGPIAIALDDVQWADPSSLLTLDLLGRRMATLPAALLLGLRPWPRSPDLDRVLQTLEAAGAEPVVLAPLSPDAVTNLVADTLGVEAGPELLAEVAGAGGNPLFVIELVTALAEEGSIHTETGRAELTAAALPPSLRLTILRRLSSLPEAVLEVLRRGSILGDSFSLTELAAITDRPVLDLSGPVADALTARVLQDDGTRLRFRHDLVREAIYEDLPGSVRRALHWDAGQRLAATGAQARVVAEHLARGATQGDGDAVAWLRSAAREAVQTSPSAAADLLHRAIELMGPSDLDRDELHSERAASLMLAGRIGDAERTCRSVLARGARPDVEGRLHACLGHVLLAQGRLSDALDELEQTSDASALTDDERAAAGGWAAMARLWLGDFDGAIGLADAARTMAPNDPITTSLALSVVALARTMRGDLHGGLDLIDDAVRLADHSRGRQGHRCPVRLYQGIILLLLDQLAEARAALEAGRRGGEELGQRWPLPSYQFHLALVRFLEGDWDDASTDIEAGLDLADEVGERYGVVLAHSVTALIALHRDDLRTAAEADAACESEIATTGSRLAPEQTLARALLLEANGEVSEARARLAEFWYPCVRAGLAVQCAVLAPDLVRLCLADGDARQAREVADVMVDLSARTDVGWISGAAARCRGLVEGDPDVLEQAADTCRHSPRPLDRAIAAEQAGVALAQVGRRDDAVRLLVEAVATYETLSAARDVTRAEALLRDLGVRRGRRGPRKRPQLGWYSLTPTEVRVASLVADGLSNRAIGDRLFILHRTVQTHVAHLFIKLGVSSRTKLGAEVTRRRADGAG